MINSVRRSTTISAGDITIAKRLPLRSAMGWRRHAPQRDLASSPGFVTPTVVWYAEERTIANAGPIATWPNGNVHAFDVNSATDQLVVLLAREKPMIPNGDTMCCATEG